MLIFQVPNILYKQVIFLKKIKKSIKFNMFLVLSNLVYFTYYRNILVLTFVCKKSLSQIFNQNKFKFYVGM